MIVSRVLPTLIKLNHVIKLTVVSKSHLLNPSGHSFIKNCAAELNIKAMSTDVNDLNNPKWHIDYNQLIAKKDKGNVVIIDVRNHSEVNETGMIPGSIHIPITELREALGEMSEEDFKKQYGASKPQKDAEIIFSCLAGGRSFKALKLGLELGYSKAGNYKGGWLDWAEKTGLSK